MKDNYDLRIKSFLGKHYMQAFPKGMCLCGRNEHCNICSGPEIMIPMAKIRKLLAQYDNQPDFSSIVIE